MKTHLFPRHSFPCRGRALPRLALLLAALVALVTLGAGPVARASTAYGTINNFDCVNDTGVECHGFEIELEDVHSADITYTYNWNHYGTPRITEDNTNPLHPRVRVRYESARTTNGTWAAYTAIPSGPIAPTDGHRFTDPSVNFGGEHFGVGYRGQPTNICYFWLVDSGQGQLVRGPAVNVATPTFNYNPPVAGAPAQVQAVIAPPPAPPILEFGPASWVKEIRTTSHNNNEVRLRDLVSDDPDDDEDRNWRNGEPDEVEVEWQLLQTEFKKADGGNNGQLAAAAEDLPDGDEIVTRRYEFYKYIGPIDPETGEALADRVAPDGIHGMDDYADTLIVGDYVGAQMSAFDNELPVGLIEHMPDGEVGQVYATRALIIAAVPFTVVTSGALPAGLVFNSIRGEVSGTPTASGVFTFGVRVTATNNPVQERRYTFVIAAPGEEVPPHSTVDTDVYPAGGGTAGGGGFYTNETVTAVMATAAPGYAFVKWTESGRLVSTSARYEFTNVVNRALVANFVARPPALAYAVPQPGVFTFAWPTNETGLVLEVSSDPDLAHWTTATNPVTVSGSSNRVVITPMTGNRFFRLVRP